MNKSLIRILVGMITERQTDRQTDLYFLTLKGFFFSGGPHPRICIRPRKLLLLQFQLFICPEIVTHCPYVTDPLQSLYCKGYGRLEAQFY